MKVEKPSPPYSLDEIIAISYVYALRKVYCYAFTYEGTPEYDIERCISGLYFKYKEFAKHATPKVAKRFYLTYDDFSNDIQQVIRSLL